MTIPDATVLDSQTVLEPENNRNYDLVRRAKFFLLNQIGHSRELLQIYISQRQIQPNSPCEPKIALI